MSINDKHLKDVPLIIGAHSFQSRLFLGTGKYPDMDTMVKALEESGTQCVTVAVRRLQLGLPDGQSLLDYLDRKHGIACRKYFEPCAKCNHSVA